jgi:hypothetical protein
MRRVLFGIFLFASLVLLARADEGMWLFNNAPVARIQKDHGFGLTPQWLEHIQKAAVRFTNGGSGSFVSGLGLVMTNHHIGLDTLQKLSSKGKDYVKNGFLARTRAEEAKAVDLELGVLMNIVDVTARVQAAVKPGMSDAEAFKARRACIATIEKESLETTKLRSDVTTLYQGGLYHLYQSKRYTDVRLVFAPEQQIAFFGGDPDNFEYPRYDLDVCLFRVYENGQPVKPEHFLKWSPTGPKENELVFVAGHPGRTDRSLSVSDISYLRDIELPLYLERLYRREVMLNAYSSRSIENTRRAKQELFSMQNNRKRWEGQMAGLLDPAVIDQLTQREQAFKDALAKDPTKKEALRAFDRLAGLRDIRKDNQINYYFLETGVAFDSILFTIARTLARAAEERPKPNELRLEEFTESEKESLELRLFSKRPIYDDLEQTKLTHSLTYLAQKLGPKHPFVLKVLSGKSPRDRAASLIRETKLKDVGLRQQLYTNGQAAIAASADPMILFARLVDPESRAVRKIFDTQVKEVQKQCYGEIARARFALLGTSTYPDATFTLRLAYGVVKGYTDQGEAVPWSVPFSGLYQRSSEHENAAPFNLPARWAEHRGRVDSKVPLNFIATTDTTGGNSGSPFVNREGEVVGLNFDSNLHALTRSILYTDGAGRSVAVNTQAITEALRHVYDAGELADELMGNLR